MIARVKEGAEWLFVWPPLKLSGLVVFKTKVPSSILAYHTVIM